MSGQETKSDLKGKVDLYGGILIDEFSLPEDSELFSIVLQGTGLFLCEWNVFTKVLLISIY